MIPNGGLFNLDSDAYRKRWENPIYVRSLAVTRGLIRAKQELAEAEVDGCNETRIHELRSKIGRYEHAKRRIESPLLIVAALVNEPSPMTRSIIRALDGETFHVG